MDAISLNRTDFKELAVEILQNGNRLRFRAHGDSMRPFIRHGDLLEVEPPGEQSFRKGEVVLCGLENGCLVAHRVVRCLSQNGQETLLVQGDNRMKADGLVPRENVLGRVVAVERHGRRLEMASPGLRLLSGLWLLFSPLSKIIFYYLSALRGGFSRQARRWFLLLCALFMAIAGVGFVLAQAASAATSPEQSRRLGDQPPVIPEVPASTILTQSPRLLQSDQEAIVLEFSAPEFQLQSIADATRPCQLIQAVGYGLSDKPGQPALPVKGVMLGLPPRVAPQLTILEEDSAPLPGRFRLCPQSRPLFETGPDGQIQSLGEVREPDAMAYALDQFAPAQPVELVSRGFIRSQAVAQLRFQPFQYNPVSGELRLVRSLRIKVSWPEHSQPGGQAVDEGPFEPVLQNLLLNYDTARLWRARPASLETGQPGIPGDSGPAYKISVNQDGLYQVNFTQLQMAGVPVASLDPRTLRLFNLGSEVAITVTGQADGAFDPGDVILFYGQKTNTRFTDTNVYWLTWGNGDGRRMPVLDGVLGGSAIQPVYFYTLLHLEQDHSYQPDYPSSPNSDTWYWSYIYSSKNPVTTNYTFTLQNLASSTLAEPLTITVRGLFTGFAATPQQHTRVLLNGHEIDNAFWPATDVYTFEVKSPQTYLLTGVNTLSVIMPMDGGITSEQLLVNWFEVGYYRAYVAANDQLAFSGQMSGTLKYQVGGFTSPDLELFDITTPFTTSQVKDFGIQSGAGGNTLTFQQPITQEHRYLALTEAQRFSPLSIVTDTLVDLRSEANGADYILITHASFYTDVLPLAAWRQLQGLRVKVVDVQEIFDEFSAGIYYPPAIHDFLAYAYANWQPPAPAYVLLMGDGNYDFKNFYKFGEPNYLPPYLADVDPWLRETDADNRYVTVSGEDNLPDLFLGRLPVKTRLEASDLVAKILTYEQNAPVSGWISQTLFVADNADPDNNFADYSDAVADHYLPAPYLAQKIYYGVPPYTSPSAAHTAILDAINQGRLVVNYEGHGYLTGWADESLLIRNDIAGFTNAGRQAFIPSMTCLDGYFIHPSRTGLNLSSLGESIVRVAGKGAIASWSATGLGLSEGHDYLDRGLFQAIFIDDVTRLGPATTQAKLYLFANTGSYRDLLDTYLLFGDPALSLNTLPAETSIALAVDPAGVVEPGNPITYVLAYTNTGPAVAHHVVISDVLSAEVTSPSVVSSGALITPLISSQLAWQVVDLAAGQGGVITITGLVAVDATLPISNTAVITTTSRDTNASDNMAGPLYTGVTPLPTIYLPVISRY